VSSRERYHLLLAASDHKVQHGWWGSAETARDKFRRWAGEYGSMPGARLTFADEEANQVGRTRSNADGAARAGNYCCGAHGLFCWQGWASGQSLIGANRGGGAGREAVVGLRYMQQTRGLGLQTGDGKVAAFGVQSPARQNQQVQPAGVHEDTPDRTKCSERAGDRADNGLRTGAQPDTAATI
jgi:hypothetical protein